ncbi:DUF262 domain-containing protein [Acetobacter pasteurianus]|uniref:GmrSD restriction endonucleases N-terminal domain-containing protein n=1 Tax=Acetobacter pasteurianus NBRC 3188 TaxID=1226663 RepID=A0A401WPZ9_ACEPA|nr:DUF262 domain-containing protein [Acetobacter pasteurianus]GCD51402.1 hypothetical protein NBRC3188_0099 [Acetobacter pasteurianus NBRC 3188]
MSSVEEQIAELKKAVSFDSRDFPIEIICSKYEQGIETDENEIFVPEYQRDFVWDCARQSRLIESIALGLPIPPIFVAENSDGRLEIVDGSQRIRTLSAFLNNELTLEKLKKVTTLNNLQFGDLEISRQRKFRHATLNFIVLSENATEEVRSDLFDRINKGSDILRNMEKRKGIYRGKFTDFIYEKCAKNSIFFNNIYLSKAVINRQEHEELILRFFALVDHFPQYNKFSRNVSNTLDAYMKQMNENFTDEKCAYKYSIFDRMVKFVMENFEFGFSKGHQTAVSRIYFEAVSVGVHLALEEVPDLQLKRKIMAKDLLGDRRSRFYKAIVGTKETHSTDNLLLRINTVKDLILSLQK